MAGFASAEALMARPLCGEPAKRISRATSVSMAAFTPYPVGATEPRRSAPGLDRRSRGSVWPALKALAGGTGGFLMQWYAALDYPVNVGVVLALAVVRSMPSSSPCFRGTRGPFRVPLVGGVSAPRPPGLRRPEVQTPARTFFVCVRADDPSSRPARSGDGSRDPPGVDCGGPQ